MKLSGFQIMVRKPKAKWRKCKIVDAKNGIIQLPKMKWSGETHWELCLENDVGTRTIHGTIIPPDK